MASYTNITVRELHDGQVVEIALGKPPANIVTMAVMQELSAELSRLSGDDYFHRLKLIMLTGQGDNFSYGASVEEHRADGVADMLPRFHALIAQMLECDVPTLARVKGLCLGGGLEVALACSMIYADADAKLGVPEISLGVFPPAASVLLPCKTGDSIVSEMVLTGKSIPAARLCDVGVVNHVADADQLDGAIDKLIARSILPRSASSLRIATRAARIGIRKHYALHIAEVESLYLKTLMATTDAVEGIEAFLEKRPPEWVGK